MTTMFDSYRRPRLGVFRLPLQKIRDGSPAELAELRAIMGRCVVVEAQYDYASNAVRYVADCEDFDPTPDYVLAWDLPRYEWTIRDGVPVATKGLC
ncbi:MAG: hypothetical protein BGO49_04475 [Planctomycetales bacterium 71-10]|nr:MAG: hypothetical protein BGO49_04475 [Planctomycetales bacterium 71-10]